MFYSVVWLFALFGIFTSPAASPGEVGSDHDTGTLGSTSGRGAADNVRPISEFFDKETQPFAFVIPQLPVVKGTTGLRARDCGTCHQKIYRDWAASTHAHAIADLQFLAEISKDESPKWLCLNCHIPVQNQRRHNTLGLIDGDILVPYSEANEGFDEALQQEGVTCVSCHVRIDEKTRESFIIGPNGSEQSPHPVRKDRSHLHAICLRCHDPKGEAITPNLVCWFTSKAELEEGQDVVKEKYGSEKNCVDCHMPEEDSRLAVAPPNLPVRKLNRHYWVGGGVPKQNELFDRLIEQGFRSGLDFSLRPFTWNASGMQLRVQLQIVNNRAGHYVPTGDPERFILTLITIVGRNDETLAKQKQRIGQIWEWNPARKLSDNRIKMGEARVQSFDFDGIDRENVSRIIVEAMHVKLTSSNVRHMMAGKTAVEMLSPGADEKIRNMERLYPTAVWIHFEEFDAGGRRIRTLDPAQLITRSKQYVGTPLGERDY